jgi:D-tyrosyl-tRNA(Tyr) deacylase
MIAVVQRVREAKVEVHAATVGSVGRGLLVLVCAVAGDAERDVQYISGKITRLRIFENGDGKMSRSVAEIGGGVLVVPQFTLAASVRRGNRPSFEKAENPERARVLCESVVRELRAAGLSVATRAFAERMDVTLVNEGPVTIIVDSREAVTDSKELA